MVPLHKNQLSFSGNVLKLTYGNGNVEFQNFSREDPRPPLQGVEGKRKEKGRRKGRGGKGKRVRRVGKGEGREDGKKRGGKGKGENRRAGKGYVGNCHGSPETLEMSLLLGSYSRWIKV
jgi:hypothetical protein